MAIVRNGMFCGTVLATAMKTFIWRGTACPLSFALVAVLATLPITFAGAQSQADKTVTKQNQVTVTATIKAIDQATRSITLRSENGDEDTFTVSPDCDTLQSAQGRRHHQGQCTYESLGLRGPQAGCRLTTAPGAAIAGGRLKDAPGGALGAQQTTTVTVKETI